MREGNVAQRIIAALMKWRSTSDTPKILCLQFDARFSRKDRLLLHEHPRRAEFEVIRIKPQSPGYGNSAYRKNLSFSSMRTSSICCDGNHTSGRQSDDLRVELEEYSQPEQRLRRNENLSLAPNSNGVTRGNIYGKNAILSRDSDFLLGSARATEHATVHWSPHRPA